MEVPAVRPSKKQIKCITYSVLYIGGASQPKKLPVDKVALKRAVENIHFPPRVLWRVFIPFPKF